MLDGLGVFLAATPGRPTTAVSTEGRHGLDPAVCSHRLHAGPLRSRKDLHEPARAARRGQDRARRGTRTSHDAMRARRSLRAVRVSQRPGSLVLGRPGRRSARRAARPDRPVPTSVARIAADHAGERHRGTALGTRAGVLVSARTGAAPDRILRDRIRHRRAIPDADRSCGGDASASPAGAVLSRARSPPAHGRPDRRFLGLAGRARRRCLSRKSSATRKSGASVSWPLDWRERRSSTSTRRRQEGASPKSSAG